MTNVPGGAVARQLQCKGLCDRNVAIDIIMLLVSTCERLSMMHEPAGVVEILVQILQNTPILKYSFRITPPPKMKIVRDLGSLSLFSFRIPPLKIEI